MFLALTLTNGLEYNEYLYFDQLDLKAILSDVTSSLAFFAFLFIHCDFVLVLSSRLFSVPFPSSFHIVFFCLPSCNTYPQIKKEIATGKWYSASSQQQPSAPPSPLPNKPSRGASKVIDGRATSPSI